MDMIKAMWPSPEDDTKPVSTPQEHIDRMPDTIDFGPGGEAVFSPDDARAPLRRKEIPEDVVVAAHAEVSKTLSPQDSGYEEALKDQIRRRIAESGN